MNSPLGPLMKAISFSSSPPDREGEVIPSSDTHCEVSNYHLHKAERGRKTLTLSAQMMHRLRSIYLPERESSD